MTTFHLNLVGWSFQVFGTLFLLLDSIRVSIRLPREGVRLGDPPQIDNWIYHWASSIGFGCLLIGFTVCGVALWRSSRETVGTRGKVPEKQQPVTEYRRESISLAPLWVFWAIAVALWLGYWFLFIPFLFPEDNSWTTRGQFGDMFGAINTLFSGLALAGIVYTIFHQRNELLEQSRLLEAQNDTMRTAATGQNILSLVNFLQSPEVRNARTVVRDKLKAKAYPWSDDEKRSADLVCSTYDVAAILIFEQKLVPAEPFVKNWGASIKDCYEILLPHIQEMQKPTRSGPGYWDDFKKLYDAVVAANQTDGREKDGHGGIL